MSAGLSKDSKALRLYDTGTLGCLAVGRALKIVSRLILPGKVLSFVLSGGLLNKKRVFMSALIDFG